MLKDTVKYYGSDLNQLIDKYCSRKMSCINLDCLLFKRSLQRLRFIESKHDNEHVPFSQLEVLQTLKGIIEQAPTPWRVDFFIVKGNWPFRSAMIEEIGSNNGVTTLSHLDLLSWLNFQLDIGGRK